MLSHPQTYFSSGFSISANTICPRSHPDMSFLHIIFVPISTSNPHQVSKTNFKSIYLQSSQLLSLWSRTAACLAQTTEQSQTFLIICLINILKQALNTYLLNTCIIGLYVYVGSFLNMNISFPYPSDCVSYPWVNPPHFGDQYLGLLK